MDSDDARRTLNSDAQQVRDQALLRSSTPLSYLSEPVPDYAASLFTHSTGADEANTTFLRESLDAMSSAPARSSTIDQSRDPRLIRRQHDSDTRGSSPTQRDRLQRYLSHLYRMHHPPASVAAAYSNRTPSPTRQSIYDWAPAPEDASTTNGGERRGGRRSQQETSPGRDVDHELISHSRERQTRRRRSEQEQGSNDHSSASPVPQRDGHPNATESMLRYFMDRERSGLSEEEERARGTGWYRPGPRAINTENWHSPGREDSWSMNAQRHETTERNRQERVDAFRREYLSGNAQSRTTMACRTQSGVFENTVKYLDSLRYCDCYDDALAAAIDLNLTTKDLFVSKHDEFILDLQELSPLYRTSFIQPGAVFEGHQYASTAILPRSRVWPSSTTVEQINPNYRQQEHLSGSTQFTAYRNPHAQPRSDSASRSHDPANSMMARMLLSNYDHWPVRMIIHAIDGERMTIQGTMEAYDVPQHPLSFNALRNGNQSKAGKKSAPITTYVEGHIIDLHNHSFLTPCAGTKSDRRTRSEDAIFPAATPTRDAENWAKLPPFNEMSEESISEMLLSKDRHDALNRDFIFMRWKERCFVHGKNDTCSENERRTDHDRGHGLTISGFYYLSMRRSDGSIEGLYYDPHTTPYQHLRLKGMKATWPAWSFR